MDICLETGLRQMNQHKLTHLIQFVWWPRSRYFITQPYMFLFYFMHDHMHFIFMLSYVEDMINTNETTPVWPLTLDVLDEPTWSWS